MPDQIASSVVVTGASGHLGCHVLQAFRAAGWQVHGVDLVPGAGVEGADLRDPATARAVLSGFDVIAHCAALPRPVGYSADAVFATNMALMHAAISAAETGPARIVHASSYSVIGLPFAPRPVSLSALPVTEAQAAQPQDVYALSKWLGEEMLSAFVRRTGGKAVSLRLPWVHNRQTFARDVLPIQDDPASSIHLWSWIDADDAGRGFVAAATADITGHQRVYLAAPTTFSHRQTVDLAAQGWPRTPISRPLLGCESLIDSARARQIIGYQPATDWRSYAGLA